MKKYILILAVCVFIISCNNNTYNNKIKSIDSINTKIDTLCKNIISYKDIDFSNRYNLMFGKINTFGKYINNKNLNTNMVIKFNEYANLSKFYKHISNKKDDLLYNLTLSKQQLSYLKHDLQKNLINTDSANVYFNTEKNIAEDLFKETNLFFTEITKNDTIFNLLNKKIDFLIDSLQNSDK